MNTKELQNTDYAIELVNELLSKPRSYTVRILPEDCIGRDYMSITNCPLCAAIKRSLPEFNLCHVAGSYVKDNNEECWFFDKRFGTGWNKIRLNDISNNRIPHFDVTFTL